MTIWFVAAIPVLIMFFALAMERLEHRLRHLAVQENVAVEQSEAEDFLQSPRTKEVRALHGAGISGALEQLRLRRLHRTAVVHSRRVGQRS